MGAIKDLQYKRLSEIIFDEEQIVTTLSVAKELKLPAYDAQNLLNSYVNDMTQKTSEEIHVTYLVCGILKDNKGAAVYLVKEDDIKEKKCLFEKISSEIIYSAQKGKRIDFHAIATINSTHDSLGYLISENCVKKFVKSRKLPVLPSTSTTAKQNETAKSSTPSGNSNSVKLQENGKNHTQSSQKQSKQKGGIASFFTKAAPKTTSNTHSKNSTEDESSKLKFEDVKEQDAQLKSEVVNVDSGDDKKEKPTVQKVDEQVTKKRKKQSKNNGPNKKRKRIQEVCDSDSSDMFDDAENQDIIEMSDEEPVPAAAASVPPTPKNKIRKAVDKTYVDEEGFIVTKTEYIYESASEDEDKNTSMEEKVLPPKKNEKINVETKQSGGKGKSNKKQISAKQPTLMSFFKKS